MRWSRNAEVPLVRGSETCPSRERRRGGQRSSCVLTGPANTPGRVSLYHTGSKQYGNDHDSYSLFSPDDRGRSSQLEQWQVPRRRYEESIGARDGWRVGRPFALPLYVCFSLDTRIMLNSISQQCEDISSTAGICTIECISEIFRGRSRYLETANQA